MAKQNSDAKTANKRKSANCTILEQIRRIPENLTFDNDQ